MVLSFYLYDTFCMKCTRNKCPQSTQNLYKKSADNKNLTDNKDLADANLMFSSIKLDFTYKGAFLITTVK